MLLRNKLFFVALLTAVFSCSADLKVKNGNSLLWKIEGNNCQPSYIFGTMHMIDAEYYSMSESMTKKNHHQRRNNNGSWRNAKSI